MHNSKHYLITLIISVSTILTMAPLNAQANWWEQVKKLLGDNEQIAQSALNDEQEGIALLKELGMPFNDK